VDKGLVAVKSPCRPVSSSLSHPSHWCSLSMESRTRPWAQGTRHLLLLVRPTDGWWLEDRPRRFESVSSGPKILSAVILVRSDDVTEVLTEHEGVLPFKAPGGGTPARGLRSPASSGHAAGCLRSRGIGTHAPVALRCQLMGSAARRTYVSVHRAGEVGPVPCPNRRDA